jgi:hypothetical protein
VWPIRTPAVLVSASQFTTEPGVAQVGARRARSGVLRILGIRNGWGWDATVMTKSRRRDGVLVDSACHPWIALPACSSRSGDHAS